MTDPRGIKVLLRTLDGRYLTGQPEAWSFTPFSAEARVFSYIADRIPEQLERLERDHGLVLLAVPVDPHDRYETCDRCGSRMLAFRAFFDGHEYLCPECRKLSPTTD